MIGNHMMLRRGSSLKEDVGLFPKESGRDTGQKKSLRGPLPRV